MPARKMRVEVYDEEGNRYTITFEGRVTREKALGILDIVELLGGMPSVQPAWKQPEEIPKIEKVRLILERRFPLVWFSAKDLKNVYESETGEHISLSTASTYLSRLADRGLLMKIRNSNRVKYRLMPAATIPKEIGR
ncbi:MAG: hypothetical protein AYL32_002110 [Candidatus Bathyarchaeota archaeon B26-2]|nr:MAG: hypothetical protein AYL32_002110 [Candidatus Bathyarchaeota archaeon B26-2]